jgi:hypothetical protein
VNDAFISIVAHKDQPHALLVRARAGTDIPRLFPAARVVCTPAADYRYRAVIPRAAVAAVIADKIAGITYTNFKASVSDTQRHNAYFARLGDYVPMAGSPGGEVPAHIKAGAGAQS